MRAHPRPALPPCIDALGSNLFGLEAAEPTLICGFRRRHLAGVNSQVGGGSGGGEHGGGGGGGDWNARFRPR
jgi:hypothetical protein